MLLMSRFIDLWNITCISSLCSIDKLSFPPFRSSASIFFCFSNYHGAVFFFLLLSLVDSSVIWGVAMLAEPRRVEQQTRVRTVIQPGIFLKKHSYIVILLFMLFTMYVVNKHSLYDMRFIFVSLFFQLLPKVKLSSMRPVM